MLYHIYLLLYISGYSIHDDLINEFASPAVNVQVIVFNFHLIDLYDRVHEMFDIPQGVLGQVPPDI